MSGTVGDGATLDARLAVLDGVAVLEPSAYPLAGFGALPAARLRCDVGRLLAARWPAASAPPPPPAAPAAAAAVAALAAFTARARLGGLEVDVDARIAYRAGGGQSWTCDADASRVAVAFDGETLLPTLRRARWRAAAGAREVSIGDALDCEWSEADLRTAAAALRALAAGGLEAAGAAGLREARDAAARAWCAALGAVAGALSSAAPPPSSPAERTVAFAGRTLGLVLGARGGGVYVDDATAATAALGVAVGDRVAAVGGDGIPENAAVADVAARVARAPRPLAVTFTRAAPAAAARADGPAWRLVVTGGAALTVRGADGDRRWRVGLARAFAGATAGALVGCRFDARRAGAWEPLLEPCALSYDCGGGATRVTLAGAPPGAPLDGDGDGGRVRVNASTSLLRASKALADAVRAAAAPAAAAPGGSPARLVVKVDAARVSLVEGGDDAPQAEALVASLDGLELGYDGGGAAATASVFLRSAQVDAHFRGLRSSSFPVILRPTPLRAKLAEVLGGEDDGPPRPVLDASATFRGGAVADLDVDLGRSLDLFVDEAAALRALALWRSYAAVFAAPRAAAARASGVALDRVRVSKLRARLSVRWSSEESERERAARERAGELAPSASSPDLAAADAPSVPRQLLDVFAAVERSRVTLPALDLEERLDVATLGALAGAHYQRGAARNALEIAGSLRARGRAALESSSRLQRARHRTVRTSCVLRALDESHRCVPNIGRIDVDVTEREHVKVSSGRPEPAVDVRAGARQPARPRAGRAPGSGGRRARAAPGPVGGHRRRRAGGLRAGRRAGRQKRANFPTSKAPISATFHSFRLMFGRAIISRNGLDARMLFSGTRARGTLTSKRT